jgi:hypothetical protein
MGREERVAACILQRQWLSFRRSTLQGLGQQGGSGDRSNPLASHSGAEHRRGIGQRLGEQPRQQQPAPIERRPCLLRRHRVDERRRGRQRHGARDGRLQGLEGVEGGNSRDLRAQALRHGGRGHGHRAPSESVWGVGSTPTLWRRPRERERMTNSRDVIARSITCPHLRSIRSI